MIDHKAELSDRRKASQNPVDRLMLVCVFFRLHCQDQYAVLSRIRIVHANAVLLQRSSRNLILKSTVHYAGNTFQDPPEVSAGNRMIRIFLRQLHVDVVRACPDLLAVRIIEHYIFSPDDPDERTQVFLVIELRILLDQFRRTPCIFQIKRFSRVASLFQVAFIIINFGIDH